MGTVIPFTFATTASPLSTNDHAAALNATASAGALVNASCVAILQQGDIVVPSMPALQRHQATARTHANNWIYTVQPTLITAIQGIVGFGNQFDAFMAPLLAAAPNVNTDPTAKSTVVQGLQLLKTTATTYSAKTVTSTNAVSSFRQDFSTDYSTFQTDLTTVSNELTADSGDSGSIAQLQAKCTADQSAMSKDLAMIAGGATAMVVGGLMIAVGALAEFETAGLSTGLIVAGAAVVAGGAVVTGIGGNDYHNMLATYKDDLIALNAAKAELALLTHVQGQLTSMEGQIGPAITALNSMQAAWQNLQSNFGTLLDAVNGTVVDGPFLQAQLNAAHADWSDLATQATKVQSMIDPPQIPLSMLTNAA